MAGRHAADHPPKKFHNAEWRNFLGFPLTPPIRRGEIRPADQLALMAEGRKNAPERATSTRLHKVAAANVARVHQIWKHSPVVKVVPDTLRDEAVQRMTARKVTGEKVKDIAADLNLSVGCLYKWVASAK
ncbi:hypothetical protein ACU79Q_005285 [Klebsiella pneumoniae]